MKTIHLQVEDSSYQALLNFIKLLPESRCRILEDETLSKEEQQQLQHSLNQIDKKDYSEFEDWDTVKEQV